MRAEAPTLYRIALGAIVVSYIAVRLWRLADSCLWFDEIFTVHAAEQPWDSILSFVALDLIHPPLFYLLLKIWLTVGGDGVFWLRLFPVVFSIFAIVPFLLLCRELKVGRWTQALSLLLLAVNGSLIKYAQEVRMYSALFCVALFSMWLFARYFNRGKSFLALVIVNIVLVHTQYFGWLVVASEIVAILVLQRHRWRPIALMSAVVFASFIPWMIAVLRAASTGMDVAQNINWMQRPGIRAIRIFVIDLVEPFYYQASGSDPESLLRVSGPILLITITSVALLLIRWKGRDEDDKSIVHFAGIFFTLPLAVAFIASWILPYSIWGTRHLIIVFAPAALLSAHALVTISIQWLRGGLITLLILFVGYGFVVNLGRPVVPPLWCGYDVLAKTIESHSPGPLYLFEDLAAYHVWFTLRKNPVSLQRMSIGKIHDARGVEEDRAYFLPRGFDGVSGVTIEQINAERIWIIYRANDVDIQKSPLLEFSQAGYRIDDKILFENQIQNIYGVSLRKTLE